MKILKTAAVSLFLAVFISACSDSGSSDKTAPSVNSTSPTSEAANISVNALFTVNFSESVNCTAAIYSIALVLEDGTAGETISSAEITCSESTATFTPAGLSNNTYYKVTISGATDSDGNVMEDYAWNFATGNSIWTGIRQLGTEGSDISEDITVDSSGNTYVTGSTEGGLDGNTNTGGYDFFVVKYDANGGKVWTRQLGTEGNDIAKDIAVDGSGNIYVTGWTEGSLDENTSAGNYDTFIVMYDSSGNKLWTKQIGTENNDFGYGITADSSGNIYVTGRTAGSLVEDVTNAGGHDVFVVKYNSSGEEQWAKQTGTASTDYATAIAIDENRGNIYVSGYTVGNFDGSTPKESYDFFVVKYDTIADTWTPYQFGTAGADYATDMALDSSGNIYVTGYTESYFEGLINYGGYDFFLVKYDIINELWTPYQYGTESDDFATGIAIQTEVTPDAIIEYVYITGTTLGELVASAYAGLNDFFVVKYDGSGARVWTRQLGTEGDEYGTGIAVSGGNIYASGRTEGDIDDTSAGGSDLFVVKYDSSGNLQ